MLLSLLSLLCLYMMYPIFNYASKFLDCLAVFPCKVSFIIELG